MVGHLYWIPHVVHFALVKMSLSAGELSIPVSIRKLRSGKLPGVSLNLLVLKSVSHDHTVFSEGLVFPSEAQPFCDVTCPPVS